MNLHEYQAKAVLREFGIVTPRGLAITAADQCVAAAAELGGAGWVIKAQVHAGGRGKAGGVKLCRSADELKAAAESLLGSRLVTYQNAPDGQPVHTMLIEETLPIARELYLSIAVDRAAERIGLVASSAGGMEIEEVAHTEPEKILRETVNPVTGLMDYQGRNLAFGLGLSGDQIAAFVKLVKTCYRIFIERDLALLEINPLVVTTDGRILPLDCKMGIDDNALYRQKTLAELTDLSQIDSKEAEAHSHNVNYIALNGNIGCMVNGAGLAMATMDLIKLSGGMPANFLDVGGGATAQSVAQSFQIILADPNVKAVLINIFGGIVRCDLIAEGIIQAVKEVGVKVPVIVRLEGTNADQGRELLATSGLAIIAANDLNDAARQAVAAAA
ncbi:MAG: ADP-forming succinate--CoA ligase subunit beta [Hydrogenophilales bacterium CG03_land_8_20_14_0_80_62_28]|nr:MAG: ADP-forming succinate--CoA ligase subunit beta [Hydrogenophilales bacterium CG03_land_8_20_14_0_80_62_28]PIX01219.1 MAG: ADP-forming succinate--CoA ligase subunit beta [Hydrogenophilales bacterium CG_4_8_14_3_um_filter_62_83]PIY97460.1 MAG: ADP-forming succinate--CoA ligase subunit beta [Hydrogenophilales bacterium CG_4_10_14_0_8_um_filter_62_70]